MTAIVRSGLRPRRAPADHAERQPPSHGDGTRARVGGVSPTRPAAGSASAPATWLGVDPRTWNGWVGCGAVVDGSVIRTGAAHRLKLTDQPERGFGFLDAYLPRGVTLSRPGPATRWNGQHVLETVAPDRPRFDYRSEDGLYLGLLCESAATNHVAFGRRLALGHARGAWIAEGMAPADDVLGLDKHDGAATTLAAARDGATFLAPLRLPRQEYTFSAWLRRRSGYGRIDITLDGGATWHEVTAGLLAGDWFRVEHTQTLADPVVGFRSVEGGDVIEIDACQLEAGFFATSEILTEGHVATRAAEALRFAAGPDLATWDFTWPSHAILSEQRHVQGVAFWATGDPLVRDVRIVTPRSVYAIYKEKLVY